MCGQERIASFSAHEQLPVILHTKTEHSVFGSEALSERKESLVKDETVLGEGARPENVSFKCETFVLEGAALVEDMMLADFNI
jgi:hypothetical protein